MSVANSRVLLVVSDVDGTLLDPDKNLTPGAPGAVGKLRAAGIRFTIVSARPPRLTHELLRELHVTEPSACFNGALLIGSDDSVLRQLPMNTSDAQTVADRICALKLDLWMYTPTDWYVTNPTGYHVQHQEGLMGAKATPLRIYDMSQYHVLKLVGVSANFSAVKQAEVAVNAIPGLAISATRSSNYYLDVTHKDANKGQVILTLSKMLHIPPQQIATIGDMQTDALMFRQSGVSIAMGNASDDVKAQAKYVTRKNTEDGFAYAMEQFVLGLHEQPERVAAD